MLVIGCKNKKIFKGFTLIELLVVLLIIGISTTLITLSFSTVSSIEKQTNSVEEYSRFLAEESIVSGNIVAWYFNSTNQYATFVSENGVEKKISNLDNSIWKDSSSLSKTFTYLDGIKIDLDKNKLESPLILFYPSGEISGGEIDIYFEDYIHRLVIKNNGKIYNEIIDY